MKIHDIKLRIIKDLCGDRILEVMINGRYVASAPSGTSKSKYEAGPLSIKQSMNGFRKIKSKLIGQFSQREFDATLRKNINILGTQLTTSLSMAFFSMHPVKSRIFPHLLGNVFGGGSHSNGMIAQEILVIPNGRTMIEVVKNTEHIWYEVGRELKNNGIEARTNLEGAWTADIDDQTALDIVTKVARRHDAKVGLDMAASAFYKKGLYLWKTMKLTRKQHIGYVIDMIKNYDLAYVEDPVKQDDFAGFEQIRKSTKALIVGDDLISTNLNRMKRTVGCIDGVIVKPNQAGNVSDAMDVIEFAKKHDIIPVVSHRSRETKDVSICKLALYSPLAKLGAGGNRKIKLNALVRMWKNTKNPRMAKLKI